MSFYGSLSLISPPCSGYYCQQQATYDEVSGGCKQPGFAPKTRRRRMRRPIRTRRIRAEEISKITIAGNWMTRDW